MISLGLRLALFTKIIKILLTLFFIELKLVLAPVLTDSGRDFVDSQLIFNTRELNIQAFCFRYFVWVNIFMLGQHFVLVSVDINNLIYVQACQKVII